MSWGVGGGGMGVSDCHCLPLVLPTGPPPKSESRPHCPHLPPTPLQGNALGYAGYMELAFALLAILTLLTVSAEDRRIVEGMTGGQHPLSRILDIALNKPKEQEEEGAGGGKAGKGPGQAATICPKHTSRWVLSTWPLTAPVTPLSVRPTHPSFS